jgi:hypothetical protein
MGYGAILLNEAQRAAGTGTHSLISTRLYLGTRSLHTPQNSFPPSSPLAISAGLEGGKKLFRKTFAARRHFQYSTTPPLQSQKQKGTEILFPSPLFWP